VFFLCGKKLQRVISPTAIQKLVVTSKRKVFTKTGALAPFGVPHPKVVNPGELPPSWSWRDLNPGGSNLRRSFG